MSSQNCSLYSLEEHIFQLRRKPEQACKITSVRKMETIFQFNLSYFKKKKQNS
jgi:hypothetical protein